MVATIPTIILLAMIADTSVHTESRARIIREIMVRPADVETPLVAWLERTPQISTRSVRDEKKPFPFLKSWTRPAATPPLIRPKLKPVKCAPNRV